jgi:hypothetical protein
MASSPGSFVTYRSCKYCVGPAIQPKQRKKIVSDAKTPELKKKLKSLLENERLRDIARQLEQRSAEMGEDHFVFGPEAQTLAAIDEDKLKKFFEDVLAIRDATTIQYSDATKQLSGEEQ